MSRPASFRARAAIFDVDGVLATTAPLHLESWRRTAEEFALKLPASVVEILRGVDRKASVEAIAAASEAPIDEARKAAIGARKNEHYLELIRGMSPADAFEGAREALAGCKARGLPVAIASSSLNAPLVLERIDLIRFVDAIADPAKVARGKPDPELLL
ncbi:MAG: HAD family hydrolase, partial [Hyphomonadaceae bacterium]